jgi:hypothetical protein
VSANGRAGIEIDELCSLAAGIIGRKSADVRQVVMVVVFACDEPADCDEHAAVTGTTEDEVGALRVLSAGIDALLDGLERGVW